MKNEGSKQETGEEEEDEDEGEGGGEEEEEEDDDDEKQNRLRRIMTQIRIGQRMPFLGLSFRILATWRKINVKKCIERSVNFVPIVAIFQCWQCSRL